MSGARRVRVEPLLLTEPPALFDAVDRLLRAERATLVPPGAYLEPARERAAEAEVDRSRLLLLALLEGRALGVLDGRVDSPVPGTLTVSQIVVLGAARGRGVARALLRAALERARLDGRGVERIRASVLPRAYEAEAFWLGLGLTPAAGALEGPPDLLYERRSG